MIRNLEDYLKILTMLLLIDSNMDLFVASLKLLGPSPSTRRAMPHTCDTQLLAAVDATN